MCRSKENILEKYLWSDKLKFLSRTKWDKNFVIFVNNEYLKIWPHCKGMKVRIIGGADEL
jgi:hypothetical protein